jgi:membrane-anchored glycerophosphoryl diester phosphodiesterase (GDPDase)
MNLYKFLNTILLLQIIFIIFLNDNCFAASKQGNEESVKENKFSSSNYDITKVRIINLKFFFFYLILLLINIIHYNL